MQSRNSTSTDNTENVFRIILMLAMVIIDNEDTNLHDDLKSNTCLYAA